MLAQDGQQGLAAPPGCLSSSKTQYTDAKPRPQTDLAQVLLPLLLSTATAQFDVGYLAFAVVGGRPTLEEHRYIHPKKGDPRQLQPQWLVELSREVLLLGVAALQ